MITKGHIEKAIDRAEARLRKCWQLLANMKNPKLHGNIGPSLFELQPELAEAIFELTNTYRELEQEKVKRIARKKEYSSHWFKQRMKLLADQQNMVNQTIAIGRGIGDAFVWFFYQRDRHYLQEHLVQQEQNHSPPGIGGKGELAFVKGVQRLGEYFIVYHGITSILRLGDFTLIDVRRLRVIGIGELKSHLVKPDTLSMTLLFSGPNLDVAKINSSLSQANPTQKSDEGVRSRMTPKENARLNRQLSRINASYEKLGKKSDKKMSLQGEYRFSALEEFAATLGPQRFSYEPLSPSLLIVGIRRKRDSLYSKLSRKSGQSAITKKLGEVSKPTLGLLIEGRKDNALYINPFYYQTDGSTHHLPGMAHLVWWPIDSNIIEDILFSNIILFTIFNPAHLMRLLENAGFVVEETKPGQYSVRKTNHDHTLGIEGMAYYFEMINQYLFSEETIVSFIKQIEIGANEVKKEGPGKILLQIEQRV